MTDEMRAKVEKVMKNLERNKMKPYFCENREEAQAQQKNSKANEIYKNAACSA